MDSVKDIVEKLIMTGELTAEEYVFLLKNHEQSEVRERLTKEAVRLREQYYGKKVYTRGLIEFTNYCKNNCK